MAKLEVTGQKRVRRQVNRLPATRRIEDIMAAARQVFSEKGYADASITDIAVKAGVVEGSIYRFFQNKRDLLIRVVENWYEETLLRDDEQLASIKGTWNKLRFIIYHHLLSIKREPALARLVLQELRLDPEYRNSKLFHLNQSYTHRVTEVVKEAIERGEFRTDVSPSFVRDLIYGCIEHRTWAFLRNEGDFNENETADKLADMVYRGLNIEPERQEPMKEVLTKLDYLIGKIDR